MGADNRTSEEKHEKYGQSTLISVIKERKTKAGMRYLCSFSRRLIVCRIYYFSSLRVVFFSHGDDDDDGGDEVSSLHP